MRMVINYDFSHPSSLATQVLTKFVTERPLCADSGNNKRFPTCSVPTILKSSLHAHGIGYCNFDISHRTFFQSVDPKNKVMVAKL